ncbi:ASST-domain-containing protein [Boeremia exigua]|uniref:ASST-domain-containing protein n=1 Tax=Boeremia exigua TaxID=749465 RepID=UPI001E8E5820|nr:ASST-domain-containing protein [Boeremia exigua]KAH6637961.1 ASST-domain-containing protein [Boeremia exigua]
MGLLRAATSIGLVSLLQPVLCQDSVSYDFNTYGANDAKGTPAQVFMSNAGVTPPQMHINKNESGLADGYVFLGMDGEPTSGQNWPTIYDFSEDRMGTLVWTGNYTEPFDFKTQTYKGQPVLTFWSGELKNGYGRGSYYILNQSYIEIARFQVARFGNDMGDIHEFIITGDDTALVPTYHAIPWDLTETGGVENGWLFDNTIQEINIETGELVFEWNASAHVGINESYNALPEDVGRAEDSPWDYFHVNSIAKDPNGDYLVSARVMDCIYKISGRDGQIIWRLGGKQSNFQVDDDAVFAFQHDARWIDDRNQVQMTLFDNGPTDDVAYSRGLLLDVNQDEKTVKLGREFTNSAKTFAQFEGSLQALQLSNGNMNYLVGYGSQPYFAELNAQGEILLDVQFGKTNAVNCYRAYKLPWEGKPLTRPDVHWAKSENKAYFSWNGQTDCEEWVVYTAANVTDSSVWRNVTTVRRTGFETTIDLSNAQLDTYVRGKAVSGLGSVLGWTQASDGDQLFDAPDDVQETTSTAPSSSTSTSIAAAARATQNLVEQVVAAAVVACGLVLI